MQENNCSMNFRKLKKKKKKKLVKHPFSKITGLLLAILF